MQKKGSFLLLLAGGLAGCQDQAVSPDALPVSDTLAGSWQLTAIQAMAPAPVPDEILVLDARQGFQLFRSGQLAAQGTYALGRHPSCGQPNDRDQLTFKVTTPGTYAPSGAYTLQNNTLVLDQTNSCISDSPIYTYKRVR